MNSPNFNPRDGDLLSPWQEGIQPFPSSPAKFPPGIVDVVVVGGGITGCTTALELARAGSQCLLIEARNIGFGTTGGTTAHLNTILDHPFTEINKAFGEDAGRTVARGLRTALDLVERNVNGLRIDCGHSWKNGFLFSQNSDETRLLEKIREETLKAGVEVDWSSGLPFPRHSEKVMRLARQAQFHPLRYIHGLAKEFASLGGILLENVRVVGVDGGDIITVNTTAGKVKARHLIHATHIPQGVNLLHFRCAPYRSYVVAAHLDDDAYPDGLYYDMEEPYHYYRTQEIDGVRLLIAGGEDHKTGHEENTDECFVRLEQHVNDLFKVERITHRWSSQYFETTDGLPYIGRMPGADDNIMVATGFSGNGMTLGTLASLVLKEQVVGGDEYSALAKLFDPRRLSPVAGFTTFVKENADVVGHMLKKPFLMDKIDGVDEIPAGEGRLVEYEGRKLGVYKDPQGETHAIDPICPHAYCTVKWNGSERSWDCPCHGSRFSVDGRLLTGPSSKDLKNIDLITEGNTTSDGAERSPRVTRNGEGSP